MIILNSDTPKNKISGVIKTLVVEYREWRERFRLKVRPVEKEQYVSLLIEPPAVKYNRELSEKRAKELKKIRKTLPELKSLFTFVDENKLKYLKLSLYQHRVLNPRTEKFVDWWDGKKKLMRRANGKFDIQGNKQGFLLQEIAALV